ncbi:MAG: hypothetical protein J1E16_07570 [Muribaculaceae bacterium]|nr:hypothetical protein [Muribaculaceae bacterium]
MEKDTKDLDALKNLPTQEAISALSEYISLHPEDDEALTIRGLKYWSLNQRKDAINDYLTALKINPESRAKMALQFANSVLDFYNKDLLNP